MDKLDQGKISGSIRRDDCINPRSSPSSGIGREVGRVDRVSVDIEKGHHRANGRANLGESAIDSKHPGYASDKDPIPRDEVIPWNVGGGGGSIGNRSDSKGCFEHRRTIRDEPAITITEFDHVGRGNGLREADQTNSGRGLKALDYELGSGSGGDP